IEFAIDSVRGQVTRLREGSPQAAGHGDERPGVARAGAGVAGCVITGDAGGPDKAAWVRFHLRIEGDTVKEARFQALACPHTMDTAAWLCEQLPGRSREELIPGRPAAWAAARAVPVEKLGRLLIVEDALLAC